MKILYVGNSRNIPKNLTELGVEVITAVGENTDRKISYIGNYRGGKAIFDLKELERYFTSGTFKYELEVYIGNSYFVPLAGQITFEEPVKVTAEHLETRLPDEKPIRLAAELISNSEKMEKPGIKKSVPFFLKHKGVLHGSS